MWPSDRLHKSADIMGREYDLYKVYFDGWILIILRGVCVRFPQLVSLGIHVFMYLSVHLCQCMSVYTHTACACLCVYVQCAHSRILYCLAPECICVYIRFLTQDITNSWQENPFQAPRPCNHCPKLGSIKLNFPWRRRGGVGWWWCWWWGAFWSPNVLISCTIKRGSGVCG